MATVTTEDIRSALLDSDPAILEMVRSRVLTPELLALPELHVQLAAEVREFVSEMREFAARTDARLSKVEDEIVVMRGDMNQMRGDIDRMSGKIDRTESSIGHLKGFFVETTVRNREDSIALQVGEQNGLRFLFHTLQPVRRSERRTFMQVMRNDLPGLSDGEIVSFVQADHIISIDDSSSGKTYIAVEASFVGDARDAERAIRNANIINALTGANSYAVVVGCHPTDGLLEMADRGDVIWHLVPENELSA
ncbi:MAG: hypothetical protein F4Y44_10255 [Chloroflexi bacterium]|nr:hypothetical protein [Chloroflexota bacterium]